LKNVKFTPAKATDPYRVRLQAAFDAQDWPLLTKVCKQVLRKQPSHLQAHRWLGFSLGKQRNTPAALQAYKHSAALFKDDAELLINYAHLLVDNACNTEALPLQERVCALMPQQVISWLELASCCYLLGLHEKGYEAACKADGLAKSVQERAAVLCQKAIHRRELGQVREAVQDCEAAIALNQTDPGNHTNRLLFMLADPDASAEQLAGAAREYAAVFEPPLKPFWPTFEEHRGDPWRRLKIGFLSPDFRAHAVMYSVEGLLAQLDRRQFEVFAFYLFPSEDHITKRVQCHSDHFIRLSGYSPDEQARMIHAQKIDILIDLAGHTGHNGLLAMARKAAPVQISWLGFPATTGLTAIDYKLTDEVTDPENADALYSERLYRLPTLFACYRLLSRNPLWRYQPRYLVQPTPAIKNRFITFGSCNNLGKLTDDVLTLWGQVLKAVPTARLLIEGKGLDQPNFVETYKKRCKALGIDTDRLDLVALDTGQQYLTYHRIDIALDPFPLTGGTTTFDLLWMGLPLVSMQGGCFKSRLSTGILTYLDRKQWLANSPEEYIDIAKKLASDIDAINTSRLTQRKQVEDSPLMNERQFTKLFGQAMREIWLRWLAQGSHPNDAAKQAQLIKQWHREIPAPLQTNTLPEVGVATGKRLSLNQAHEKLQYLLEQAKTKSPDTAQGSGQISDKNWREVTEFAETVLSAIPHEPLALACLAEVEHAHGHTDFAVTYLQYAAQSINAQ